MAQTQLLRVVTRGLAKRAAVVASCALLGTVSAVFAQTVGGLDLQAIQNKADTQAKDLAPFLDRALRRADDQKAAATDTADTSLQRIKSLDRSKLPKGPDGPVDFDELIAGAQGNLTDPKGAPLLIAFASLSMPPESLKRMIDDVRHAGGVVVFRGFPGNSGKAFGAAMIKVVDRDAMANVAIDPRLFRAFNVQSVPTYVVTSSDFRPCDGFDCKTDLPDYDRIAGNATVQYVLSTIADANGPGSAIARVALNNLAKPE